MTTEIYVESRQGKDGCVTRVRAKREDDTRPGLVSMTSRQYANALARCGAPAGGRLRVAAIADNRASQVFVFAPDGTLVMAFD